MGLKCLPCLSLLYRKLSKGLGRQWICHLRPALGVSGGHTFHRHCAGSPRIPEELCDPSSVQARTDTRAAAVELGNLNSGVNGS